jgi:ubiquinone/menaquinone biosynthesis C-methylase UbiE
MKQAGEREMLAPIYHPVFATAFEWMARMGPMRRAMDPVRRELVGQARGYVLEVGAGSGLNFAFYVPGQVERVAAIEPDAAMLRYARQRATTAPVPITLTQAPVEALPFADETFDSAVVTLVFCSVADPPRGLQEIYRVLKPGGMLLMAEHVRAQNAIIARIQDMLVPLTTRLAGNCHWNRDTAYAVARAGFQITHLRSTSASMLQLGIVLYAVRP